MVGIYGARGNVIREQVKRLLAPVSQKDGQVIAADETQRI